MKAILSAERFVESMGIVFIDKGSRKDIISLIRSRDAAIIERVKDFASEYFVCSLNMGYTDFLAELDSALSDLNGEDRA